MRSRDRAVLVVLGATLLLGVAVWSPIGRWASLVVLLAGMLVCVFIYRAAPPMRPPEHLLHPDRAEEARRGRQDP